MIFGVGVFGKGLGHEVGALMMELMPSEEETKENLFPLSVPHEATARRQPSANQGEWEGGGLSPAPNHAVPLISDFSAFRTVRNTFLLFKPPSYGNLLQQPELGHQDI